MGSALRILQAGELCLNEPLYGISGDLPPNLQTSIINARFLAAKKLFSAAMTESVHLVVLAGKFCLPNQETRPYWFLQEQFQRLKNHGIQVVCVEPTNHFHWPSTIPLPENVHIFSRSQSTSSLVINGSKPIELQWASPASNQSSPQPHHCVLRLSESMGRVSKISYQGNNNQGFTQISLTPIQRGALDEARPAHATLVEVDSSSGVSHSTVETEVVQFSRVNLEVAANQSKSQLQQQLIEQFKRSEEELHRRAQPTLVSLSLTIKDHENTKFSNFEISELLSFMQNDAQARQSHCWPVRLLVPKQESETTSHSNNTPVQIALGELESLALDDVYENLDLQVLDIDQHSLERLKEKVAQRLPELLTEHRQNSA
ncbi:hypothetical protein [Thalassoglobus polymorphus]|uniref:Putative metallophosphoesterase YhaO n=1 Tax=Thalassoglobus polymorphus TaxID=2527994 RepID=A0A517QH73_9PLAN|nr:hypothetical protein [Thalassoglobus polymorphus]QDT30897.1 putative metallophosphoesterase YhaO [Thalassoglobus polymorphus]